MTWAFIVDSVPFNASVIAGQTSLGGSESACLGVARAIKARGHEVHVFTTQLDPECDGKSDHAGVVWHSIDAFAPMNRFIEWDVCVALRSFSFFYPRPVYARLRILWTQDLLVPGDMVKGVMGAAWAYDRIAYVSAYHRAQWEDQLPELSPVGWVTRNSYDPADLPEAAPDRHANRIIHTSRPERGLGPILEMWPMLREQHPDAELRICRYSSMYDTGPGSWSEVCASWDQRVQAVNEAVGGITYLGELNKRDLYSEMSRAAVMWYPGMDTFAETGCLAAIEAQACGTPFVGSYLGVLPGLIVNGRLVKGKASDEAYQLESVGAVAGYLSTPPPVQTVTAGIDAMRAHRHPLVAAEWERMVENTFRERLTDNPLGVLRRLIHDEEQVAVRLYSARLRSTLGDSEEIDEAERVADNVITGRDMTADVYGDHAISPELESTQPRVKSVVPQFKDCTRVLDVACGNGAYACAIAQAHPNVEVVGIDFSGANIEAATKYAEELGLSDRVTFEQSTVYDFDSQRLSHDWEVFSDVPYNRRFDGLFVGEFIEHIGKTAHVIDGLEEVLSEGATVVYTCPHGAFVELLGRTMPWNRGHVHRFHHDDIHQVWGRKKEFGASFLDLGTTIRGEPIGHWIIRYTVDRDRKARDRDLLKRIQRTRPLQRLSVGIIAKNAEANIVRCLESVYNLADEILVGVGADTVDKTADMARGFEVEPRTVRVVDIPAVAELNGGFSEARNLVLEQATGDWFLWIDTDEVLMHPENVSRYIQGSPVYRGFVLQQTHLYLDGPPTYDIPVRLFRTDGNIKFYGCVHEQPQDGDANTNIHPTLELIDTRIAHFGYLEEGMREHKRVTRNLPLLQRDAEVFPERRLGKVLLLREATIHGQHYHARKDPRAADSFRYAVKLFVEHFDDPGDYLDGLARPWYEIALQGLGIGWEHQIALAGRAGGLQGRQAKPETVWVRDGNEYLRIVGHKAQANAKGMQPTTFTTDPDDLLDPAPDREETTA